MYTQPLGNNKDNKDTPSITPQPQPHPQPTSLPILLCLLLVTIIHSQRGLLHPSHIHVLSIQIRIVAKHKLLRLHQEVPQVVFKHHEVCKIQHTQNTRLYLLGRQVRKRVL